uniref:Reverse transcriptase domain-containing protein n=1 Tax=Tanacetum cinerariifolium TaxID=118510 RepID=A0A699IZ16_TANCI|nr:reverse transcriptase domain-containing protein [Tanacetum cinerariifolium]
MLKILVEGGVITLKSSKLVPLECAMVSKPTETPSATKPIAEERFKVAINLEYLKQIVIIGSTLTEGGHNKLCELLQRNLDIFAWKPADMTGVPRHIVEHRLNVQEGCSPIRQKKKGQAADRSQAIQEEVEKLVGARLIREVHYHDWLSNPVMVKKHDGSWRMCVDFKDLNKACPKDGYTLPEIDWKVESLCGVHFKCFLDTYKGYHQIQMATEDEDKTEFIASQGIFCYTKMPFGLKNAGATYQPNSGAPYANGTNGKRRAYCLLSRSKRDRMTEKEAKQMPVYFVSRALRGPELNYTSMEKLVLALVHASKRLKKPRISVKGQILVDFIVDRPEKGSPDTPMEEEFELPEPWILFTDGSSRTDEYEALIAGLRIAEQMGVKNLQANVDSRLVANQVNGTYVSKEADLIRYLETVLVEELKEKSISEIEILAVVEKEGDTWMTPLFKYLAEGTLPEDVKKARAIKRKSWRFTVVNETLYKKSFLGPWLRYMIRRGQSFANWLLLAYYAQGCKDANKSWGIDIAGPFPEDPGKFKFLIVAMDYFKKWIKAKPVATITGYQIKKIMWENVSYKFGLPGEIIQIMENSFGTIRLKIGAKNYRMRRNKSKVGCKKKELVEELPHVLWAHRTMIKSSNEDTSFSLTYGTEAIIPAEIGMPTLRTVEADLVENNEALEINLDLLEERREEAAIREAKNTGKLGPKWEGPYEVTKALGKGAYKLRGHDRKQLPRT